MSGFSAPNHTQTPNDLFDKYMMLMGESELKVTLAIIRKTLGFHKKSDPISLTQLQKATGLSRQGCIDGAEAAIKRGLVRRIGLGKRGVTVYEMVIGADQSTTLTSENEDWSTELTSTSQQGRPVSSQHSRHTKETTTKDNVTKETVKDSKDILPSVQSQPIFAAPCVAAGAPVQLKAVTPQTTIPGSWVGESPVGETLAKANVGRPSPVPRTPPTKAADLAQKHIDELDAQKPQQKKPRPKNPNEPMHDELVKAFGLEPGTLTSTADSRFWTVAAELSKINFPMEFVRPLYNWCKGQDWPGVFTPFALSAHAPNWLSERRQRATRQTVSQATAAALAEPEELTAAEIEYRTKRMNDILKGGANA